MSDLSIIQQCEAYVQVLNIDSWTKVDTDVLDPEAEIWYSTAQPKRCWIQLKCEVGVLYSFYKLTKRPEFVCRHPSIGDAPIQFHLVEHFAPGDALMRCRIVSKEHEGSALVMMGSDGPGWQHIRCSSCNDFPCPGQYTLVMVSIGSHGINFAGAAANAIIMTCEAGRGGESTRIRYVFQCPWDTYPEWFTCACINILDLIWQEAMVLEKEQPKLQDAAEAFYTILSLRSCSRGPPLLPQQNCCQTTTQERIGGFFWQASEKDGFNLSLYLRQFLTMSGCHADVFKTLYGQQLMPYQAAIMTEDWERIQDRFEDAFHSQCSAYRFLRGGKAAPKIRTNIEPKFTQDSAFCSEPTASSSDGWMVMMTEDKTFLNVRVAHDGFASAEHGRKAAEYP